MTAILWCRVISNLYKNARTFHIRKCWKKKWKIQVWMWGRIRNIKMSFKFIFIILIVLCCVALIQHVHMYKHSYASQASCLFIFLFWQTSRVEIAKKFEKGLKDFSWISFLFLHGLIYDREEADFWTRVLLRGSKL